MAVRLKYIFLLLICMTWSVHSFSQPNKKFSTDPQSFIDELTKLFDATQSQEQKAEGKDLMKVFSEMWLNQNFSKTVHDSIYSMCNIMQLRKMKTYPNFESYLNAAMLFAKSNQTDESFKAWSYGLRKLAVMSNSIRFMVLLDATNSLLKNNILCQSQIMNWHSGSNEFTFKFDSVPVVEFGKCDLTCVKKNDSTTIYGTSGIFYPTLNKWKGKGGKILWERAGFPPNVVYAEIFKYSLSTQKSEFDIDTVRFTNTNFFDKPLMGSLKEKVLADVTEERTSYPRFTSFDKRLQIKNIFKNVDYDGGFAMYGPKLMGMGDRENEANLFFKRDNKLFVRLSAKNFIIRRTSISSDRAAAAIYWLKDSIYHPGLKMRYNDTIKELSLMRDKVSIGESPFFDSYHKIDIYVEAVYWKMDQPKIDLSVLKGSNSESSAIFESDNYYSEHRFDKLRGMEEVHPLYVFRDIATARGSKTFTVEDVQKKMHVGMDQIIAILLTYANAGFLIYDIERGIVTVKDRVYHYLNAKNRKTDYDVIQFNSQITGKPNATLSLLNFDLSLNGVPRVILSDSQSVFVYPKDQELTLKKNRDFVFSGQIHAGLFDYYGSNFDFSYDKFKLNLAKVDSMCFKVQDTINQKRDMYGHYPLVRVRSAIEDLTGEIIIDSSGNKSGKISYRQFPIFKSTKDAYVYYDKSFIYKGVYARNIFYYRVYPFTIDTLDSYSSERKSFSGYLVSAGIFPDIKEPLRVQPDYSLGFIYKTPSGGLPAYGGKGTYDSIIDLSFKGFRGRGSLHYLTSTTKSNDILFFPDSMVANAEKFITKEKPTTTEYPEVVSSDVYVQWYPYKDLMHVSQRSKPPFSMFHNDTRLNGTITLTPKGMTGDGVLSFNKVEMSSRRFEFKHHVFTSDTTDVIFKTPDLSEMVLRTQNFNVTIDFEKQRGKFTSNDKTSKISFPFNNYACYLYNFDWSMNSDELILKSANMDKFKGLRDMKKEDLIDMDLTESGFVSEHPGQDSIRFYAPVANYNLSENIIYAKDVPVILIADAAIFPDSGKVTVLKKAEMLPLEKAQLIVNTSNKKHLLYNCKLNIETRNKYSGLGTYDYIDEADQKEKINFSSIFVDNLKSRATGDISEDAKFTLSPNFTYMGKVKLTAEKDLLNFEGGVRIKYNCDTLAKPWLLFNTDIDPKNIMIPVSDKPREYVRGGGSGSELGTGLYAGDDTTLVYSAFIQYKHKGTDEPIITGSGFLTFDNTSRLYRIMPMTDSTAKYPQPYDMVEFNPKDCFTTGDGKVNITSNLGRMKMQEYGDIKHTMLDKVTDASLLMTMDFPFNEAAMAILTKAIESEAGAEPVSSNDPKYDLALRYMVGPEKAQELAKQISLLGRIKVLPDELIHTFFLANVNLKWNFKTRSFVSYDDLGFASIDKTQVYKNIKGNMEITRKRSGSIVYMYLDLGTDWYFFTYQSNRMQAISSNKEFNNAIKTAMADNKNQFDAKDKEPAYQYVLGNSKRKNDFLIKIGAMQENNNDNQ